MDSRSSYIRLIGEKLKIKNYIKKKKTILINQFTFRISGAIINGPAEEKEAMDGLGFTPIMEYVFVI